MWVVMASDRLEERLRVRVRVRVRAEERPCNFVKDKVRQKRQNQIPPS